MQMSPIHWIPSAPAFTALLNALASQYDAVYIVGGQVRDLLLGRRDDPNDLDVVVPDQAVTAARRTADRLGWACYALDTDRDMARLIFTAAGKPLVCDIAAMRGDQLDNDLRERDFTVNAMALRWQHGSASGLVDPTGGQQDLAARRLRTASAWSLAADPVRMLRAVRLATQFGFTIDEATDLQLRTIPDSIRLISPERVRDELWKIFAGTDPDRSLQLLRHYRLLQRVLPEVADLAGVEQSPPHDVDVYEHTLRTLHRAVQLRDWVSGHSPLVDTLDTASTAIAAALTPYLPSLRRHLLEPIAAERRPIDWLPWCALWHDVGKPPTRTQEILADGSRRYRFFGHEEAGAQLATRRLDLLKFSRPEIALLQTVVHSHMRPHLLHSAFPNEPVSRRACYRFFHSCSGGSLTQLTGLPAAISTLLLALADYQAIYPDSPPPAWSAYVRHITDLVAYGLATDGLAQVRTPLVDGHLLMHHFQLPPGRQVGTLLEQLREAQAAGEITTREEGLTLAQTLLDRSH
jgi:tRNA nucleotidyltransferase/poly(A) polymerase